MTLRRLHLWTVPIKPVLHNGPSACFTTVCDSIKRSTKMMHRLLCAVVLALALEACGSAPAASVSTLPTILPTALPTVVPLPTAMPTTTLLPTQDAGSQIDAFLKKLTQQGLF